MMLPKSQFEYPLACGECTGLIGEGLIEYDHAQCSIHISQLRGEKYWLGVLGEWVMAGPNRGWDLFEGKPDDQPESVWLCHAVEGIHPSDSELGPFFEGRGGTRVEALQKACRLLFPDRFKP